MKKITALLLIAGFILPSAIVFADDSQDTSTQNIQGIPMPKNLPKPPDTHAAPPRAMMMMGMPVQKTVVATSDGGIVIVEGNKIIKFDKNLEITKSIELTDGK